MHIGVSGINAVDNPGPGIAVARSLKQDVDLNAHIVGLAYDALEPGHYMDWVVDKSYLLPYPSGGGDGLVERLSYVRHEHGLDFVIPNLDSELPLFIKCERQLEEHGIRTFLPSSTQFRLRNKDALVAFARTLDIQVPATEVVTSQAMLISAVEKLGLPVMVKGCLYKAFRADTMADALAFHHQLVAEWGYPIIVQRVVAGDEVNVVGLGDGEGNAMGLVAIKKSWVTSLGKMWSGVTVKHPAMLAAAANFVRQSRWRGPFEMECIVADGDVFLIEINPRFPAWVYAATGVGLNLPAQLVRLGMGLPLLPLGDYPAGKLFIRYSFDLVTDMAKFESLLTRGESP